MADDMNMNPNNHGRNPLMNTAHEQAKDSAAHARAQQSSIYQLLECALLEAWIRADQYQIITVQALQDCATNDDWLTVNMHSTINSVWRVPAADTDQEVLVTQWHEDQRLIIAVTPSYCMPITPSVPFAPLWQKRSAGEPSVITHTAAITTVQALLPILLSWLERNDDGRAENSSDESVGNDRQAGIKALEQGLIQAVHAKQCSARHPLPTSIFKHHNWYRAYRHSEQWASLADRPFHPLAKSKVGLNTAEYQQYMAEFNQPISLRWLAVDRRYLMQAAVITADTPATPAQFLLTADQQQCLQRDMQAKQLADSHVAIPVHPWQWQHACAQWYRDELESGVVTELDFVLPDTWATSSLRSLLIETQPQHSIKLPLAVAALNSKRYLPAVKLINGEKNQALLQAARATDALLAQQLWLCDERFWWGFMPQDVDNKTATNAWLFQEKPTQLGAMIRSLPAPLCTGEYNLLPMASIGMVMTDAAGRPYHIFDELLRRQQICAGKGGEQQHAEVLALLASLCAVFFSVHLRCYRLGLMPELHGQNVVLVIKDTQFMGVLLRDHDSVRIYRPWLAAHGLRDPDYLSPHAVPNRLYQPTPTDLLFYLQSLGILVNIRSIVEAVRDRYDLPEMRLWQTVRHCLAQSIADIDFSDEQRALLIEQLLDSRHYPHKTILRPLIERGAMQHGSMPAGQSKTCNPLFVCTHDNASLHDQRYEHQEHSVCKT